MAVTTSPKSGKQTLKLVEALDEIGVSRAAFYRMRARGQAPRHLKLPNGQIRIRRADLDAWFDSCEVPEAC
ncbi:helix-turn-helix transcriptional regulator [Streptomyces sp. NBC_00079]|uniref:helix-turn-helix transcriptional regulator n=1 Tax=Streptomyces sp. NBC_00079 TaxID=2975644 RepID=UPI003866F04B